MKNSKDIAAFTIRIPAELKFQLDMIATKDSRSTNALIKIILQNYVEENRGKK